MKSRKFKIGSLWEYKCQKEEHIIIQIVKTELTINNFYQITLLYLKNTFNRPSEWRLFSENTTFERFSSSWKELKANR